MTSLPTFRRSPWLAAAMCAMAGAAVFQFFGNATRGYIDSASLFYWWGLQWFNPQSETEHGLLIVPLAIGLLVRNIRSGRNSGCGIRNSAGGAPAVDSRQALPAGESRKPDSESTANSASRIPNSDSAWPAFAALGLGLALHFVGFAAQQTRISVVALLVFAWGVLRLGGGRRWGDAAMFPLAFLVFAIPFNALDSIGFWLRLWVIKVSAGLAHAAGIGVLQSGTQLVAPDGRYQYDVAAACSGVRSLMALLALAMLVGYLNFRSWWRRLALFLLCFPLIYLGNVLRISSIIFVAQWRGQRWGEGAHDVMGYGVFVVVLGGLMLAARLWQEREGTGATEFGIRDAEFVRKSGGLRRAYWVAIAVIGLAGIELGLLSHLASMPPRGLVGIRLAADGENPVELPVFLGNDWIGRRSEVTAVEREILPPDTGYARKEYVSIQDLSKRVFMSVVLSGRDRTSIHRPELCLVGQGWTIDETLARQFSYPGPGAGKFPVTLLRVKRQVRTAQGAVEVPQLVAYWFIGGDTVVASHWRRLVVDAWNRIFHARADRWAYVLLQTDARDGEAAALQRMQTVLDQTLPTLLAKPRSP